MAIMVAKAAPVTSIFSPATNRRSRIMLIMQDMIRNKSEERLSPTPLRIPAFML